MCRECGISILEHFKKHQLEVVPDELVLYSVFREHVELTWVLLPLAFPLSSLDTSVIRYRSQRPLGLRQQRWISVNCYPMHPSALSGFIELN